MYKDKSVTRIFLVSIGLIFVDQLSKYIIRSSGGFYICNKGISFGIHLGLGIFYLLWIIITASIVLAIIKSHSRWTTIGLIIVLSGALSNIIDRLFFGCVIDFIDIKVWPVFNIADICISFGVILLITKNILQKKSP